MNYFLSLLYSTDGQGVHWNLFTWADSLVVSSKHYNKVDSLWILKDRKRQRCATMASLPAKNLPWQPWTRYLENILRILYFKKTRSLFFLSQLYTCEKDIVVRLYTVKPLSSSLYYPLFGSLNYIPIIFRAMAIHTCALQKKKIHNG